MLKWIFWLALSFLCGCAGKTQPPLQVASKNFTESVILGEILARKLRADGLQVAHRRQLGGTRVLWEALRAGEIDLYPEYTGTLEQEILHTRAGSIEDLRAQLAPLGIGLSRPLGFNNTYALAMRAERARQLRLSRISQLSEQSELNYGFGHEFLQRKDGWPQVKQLYHLQSARVAALDHDLAYRALAEGHLDVMEAYSTDAEVQDQGLLLLEDDLKAFPRYDAVVVYRLELEGQLSRPLNDLAGSITEAQMARLNGEVRLGRHSEEQVAARWMGAANEASSELLQRLVITTRRHLELVVGALMLASLMGLPLGMTCHLSPRVARPFLAAVNLVQTVPALALLVFLIPLTGLGYWTAMLALTLYALLPIVQGTYLGLQTIPLGIRESADSLGLSRKTRWWRVNLPLALPGILSGLQTATVIAVGNATLAALIGAGGYGDSILTGVRLARTDLLLEGALPSACMALLAQAGFNLLRRRLQPSAEA